MTVNEMKNSISVCGLVCVLCSGGKECEGCRCKTDSCKIKDCASNNRVQYCYECEQYPCNEGMFKSVRINAFNRVAKEEGLQRLAEYLTENYKNGIKYHGNNGLKGDYDKLQSEQEVISLLKNGKPDPYEVCPTYESKSFFVRLISEDDAEDLLNCYSNVQAQQFFNSDNCTSDFRYSSINEVHECIILWLNSYIKKEFVRFSIINKHTDNVVGTVEIFGGGYGVLRIDLVPKYEFENYIKELLKISDSFLYDFSCDNIVTKAIPEATERIKTLNHCGYIQFERNKDFDREHYYIKYKNDEDNKLL